MVRYFYVEESWFGQWRVYEYSSMDINSCTIVLARFKYKPDAVKFAFDKAQSCGRKAYVRGYGDKEIKNGVEVMD